HDKDVRLALVERAQKLVRDLECGHLRREIVSRDLRRRYQQTFLVRKLALSPAIEEIGYVRVFLGFSETKIVDFMHGKDAGQDVARQLGRKRDRQRISLVVNRKANKVCVWSIQRGELIEAGNCQRARNLPCAISTEVEEDNGVAILNRGNRIAIVTCDNNRLDEFIGDTALVARF